MKSLYLIYYFCGIVYLWLNILTVLSIIAVSCLGTTYLVNRYDICKDGSPYHNQKIGDLIQPLLKPLCIFMVIISVLFSISPSKKNLIEYYVITELDTYNGNVIDSKLNSQQILDTFDTILKRVDDLLDVGGNKLQKIDESSGKEIINKIKS